MYNGRYHCDFCLKSQDDLKALVAGPDSAAICNECVGVCIEILTAGGHLPIGPEGPGAADAEGAPIQDSSADSPTA